MEPQSVDLKIRLLAARKLRRIVRPQRHSRHHAGLQHCKVKEVATVQGQVRNLGLVDYFSQRGAARFHFCHTGGGDGNGFCHLLQTEGHINANVFVYVDDDIGKTVWIESFFLRGDGVMAHRQQGEHIFAGNSGGRLAREAGCLIGSFNSDSRHDRATGIGRFPNHAACGLR